MRVVVALAAGVVVGQQAAAQTVSPAAPASRDVVIVTGVGPARTSDELIVSTSVLEADQIAERLSNGLGDTLSGLPGVSTTAFGPGASRPVIRGLGAERVQVLTNGIGVIDASAASPDHAVTGDPLGAERIEILRGPATLAYGGGATGGVVNVIDGLIAEALPEQRLSGAGYAGYTSVDEGSTLSGRVTAAAGKVAATLAATRRDAGDVSIPGYAESARLRAQEHDHDHDDHDHDHDHHDEDEHDHVAGVLRNSFVESNALSGGLSYVGERGFLGASVRRLESRYGVVGHSHVHHAHEEHDDHDEDHDHDHHGESPFIDMEQTRFDARGGLTFDSGAIDRLSAAVSFVDYQHTEFEAPGEPSTLFKNKGFEARIEAEHVDIAGFKGSFGLQASRRDFSALGAEAFLSPTVTEQWGVFAFETFERGEWGMEGGLRYDEVRLDNIVSPNQTFATLNASLGWHAHVSEHLFLGASISRTERAPTDVDLYADGPHLATQQYEIGDANLVTEKGVNIEARATWKQGPVEIGGSVYRFAFSDFIYLSPTGAEEDGLPVFQAVQGDATFTGAEATLAAALGEGLGASWRTDVSADVVRGELDGGGPGKHLPRIPPMSATLGVEAQWARVSARLEARWADAQDRVAMFELPTDSYTTIGLRVNRALNDRVDLLLEGVNLTDEEVRVHASPLKEIAPLSGRGGRIALKARF